MVIDAIASLRAQTFADYRVVVGDDVSRTDAADAVERHIGGLGDPRFSFHRQTRRAGEYGQGRFFFGAAVHNEFFMILHDDDVLRPNYLENAVRALDTHIEAAFFVADMDVMDSAGMYSPTETERYRTRLARVGAPEGVFDVLTMHVLHGFAPISGTVFRKSALDRSGFVDPDLFGNYPFECDVFLRLGEIGAKAWFSRERLMAVRFHAGALRNQHEMDNPPLVRTVIRLWEGRRFKGELERKRKVLLSRFYRADSLIRLREGDLGGARSSLRRALRDNWRSFRAWSIAPMMIIAPSLLRAVMRPLTVLPTPPSYGPSIGQTETVGRSDFSVVEL
jgi:GT2 family glycosyltransferase